MKKIFHIKFHLKSVYPYGIILIVLVISGSIAYAFSPKLQSESDSSKNVLSEKIVNHTTHIPSPTFGNVLGANTYNPTPNPTITAKVIVTPNENQDPTSQPNAQSANATNNNANNQSVSSGNTTSQLPTATVTPVPTQQPTNKVSLQIQDPAGTATFTVTLKDGANVCDVLQETKDEGKITSLTLNSEYLSTLHSKYVTEINGFSNNWTFTVNENTSLGCSLTNPKPNDTIVWKFG